MTTSIASASESSAEVLESPIVIVRGLVDTQNPHFALDELRRQYGPRRVEMIRQKATEDLPGHGWDLPPQYSHLSSLGPYIQKMIAEEEGGHHKKKRKKEKLLVFAANVDMDDMSPQCEALREMMPAYLRWGGDFDLLKFVRQAVPGVTQPQLYFKVRGNWTGGHEENLRLSSVNCNHGPGSSRWYAVDSVHASALRDYVLKTESIDLYMREGNWWPKNVDALVEAGIPVRTGIQGPGDVVVLRGSTLHWVQAESASLHSSWNLCVCDALQIKQALERAAMNDLGSTCVSNIVFLRTLLCDFAQALVTGNESLNNVETQQQQLDRKKGCGPTKTRAEKRQSSLQLSNEMKSEFDKKSRMQLLESAWTKPEVLDLVSTSVARTFETESANVTKLSSFKRRQREREGSLVLRCDQCAAELLLVYARCDTCLLSPELNSHFFCADCGTNHRAKRRDHDMIAITKGSLCELKSLAGRLEVVRQRRRTRDDVPHLEDEEKRKQAIALLARRSLALSGPRINRQSKQTGDASTQTYPCSPPLLVNSREAYDFKDGHVVQFRARAPLLTPPPSWTQPGLIRSQREKLAAQPLTGPSGWHHARMIAARQHELFMARASAKIARDREMRYREMCYREMRRTQRIHASEISRTPASSVVMSSFPTVSEILREQGFYRRQVYPQTNAGSSAKEGYWATPSSTLPEQQPPTPSPMFPVVRRRYEHTRNLTSVANAADPRFFSAEFRPRSQPSVA